MNIFGRDPRRISEELLALQLPRRWTHVQAVGAKAERIEAVLGDSDGDALVAAAWLHDIGYAQPLVVSGFHPLDGARWLRQRGFDTRVVNLVANHTYALLEAEERGLDEQLRAEFPSEDSPAADALTYCDITTGPDGQQFDALTRIAEIRTRYGPDHLVTRFIDRATPLLVAAVARTDTRLAAAPPP